MGTDTKVALSPTEILKRPYHRVIVPEEDGAYSAMISEFPGCLAMGDSAAEAYATLEEVAEGWLLAAIANNQPIPEPDEEPEYSGKLALRLPKSLHAKAAHFALRDGVSLNAYICTAIAHYAGMTEGFAHIPSNIVNVVTGPNVIAPSNVQQLIMLDPAKLTIPVWANVQAGLQVTKSWRRENG